ncbi:hypothetical protein B0A50_07040 [Salinomyces thailandicus]|uniref:CNH domain-containing protein n=1 Tax=Salinomyces thailandicus TaxID=706561 RepID=A0A4U0TP04_9PEZI|nr:hypothetical protein B0A50_07040 [Salinomyces thailandica]
MEADHGSHTASTNDPEDDSSFGTYALRELIRDIPLSEQPDGERARITCIDTWNGNLYIGTSAGEVLHYVSIPGEGDEEQPSYIFATRLEPPFNAQQDESDQGVKQLLLLPDVGKACVLCNGTLTFYTLPELSPAMGGKIKQPNCLWVGGIDHNEILEDGAASSGTVVVICLKQRLRLIRIGEEARKIRDIELGGVSAIQRRDDLACVADGQNYSLLDVVNQRKIELFPISSLSEPEPAPPEPQLNVSRSREEPARRSFSATSPTRRPRGHERNFSLGIERLRPDSSSPWPARSSSRQPGREASPSPASGSREASPIKAGPAEISAHTSAEVIREPVKPLPPNIASPTPNEFLLTTGTKMSEPGVGMFVNLDGDVVRGTIEFSTYPESLVLDSYVQNDPSSPDAGGEESHVLALVRREVNGKAIRAIEAQPLASDPGDAQASKSWLSIRSDDQSADEIAGIGLRLASTTTRLAAKEVSNSLRLRRLKIGERPNQPGDSESKRNEEEDRFASRFAQLNARVLLYHDATISWVVRNALILQLDRQLNTAIQQVSPSELEIDVHTAQRVVNSIRGQEARNELEFLTLTYIRQKASLLLFGNLILQTIRGFIAYEHDKRRAEDALIAGEIDPRTILSMVPPLADEVDEGEQGIWISQGLSDTVSMLRKRISSEELVQDPKGAYGDNLLQLIKRYLLAWRKKKGFGSVADEAHVFRTVDAALLHVLLMLDQSTPRGPATPGTVRAELNDVIDRGVDCFERAKQLFEQYQRLYLLSRLYQSRKTVGQVLATWKRIIEGDRDAGGELIEGEHDVRRYLTKLRDQTVVQEYGSWLANRNPKLGVQVFADDRSRVHFQPQEAVAILKEKAPGAVKDYLEHLVFGKNHVQYVNDLIAFYLDTVLSELEKSEEARQTLVQSYETYRALRPPKPTYRQFITDNATEAEWWHNRLRLLQLIGGSHGAASKYDVHTLGERLTPYSNELVPEMIILNGREGKHEDALKLLTHGLGDYDTAIRYCLLGGSSIFHPGTGLAPEQALPTKEEQAKLFEYLLHEFFHIEDLSERLERTAELLERFGGWFDVARVVALIPNSWSVELVSGFLVHALRRLVRERNETVVVKALSGAQNLRLAVEFADKMEGVGPSAVDQEVDAG